MCIVFRLLICLKLICTLFLLARDHNIEMSSGEQMEETIKKQNQIHYHEGIIVGFVQRINRNRNCVCRQSLCSLKWRTWQWPATMCDRQQRLH